MKINNYEAIQDPEKGLIVKSYIKVRYAETDKMGVVYYANYMIWMEVSRTDFCTACGFKYLDMERNDGAYLAVAEAHCRYVSPAFYDDEVTVVTWVSELRPRVIKFEYEIYREKTLLATGYTVHVVVDSSEGKAIRFPAKYVSLLSKVIKQSH